MDSFPETYNDPKNPTYPPMRKRLQPTVCCFVVGKSYAVYGGR